MKKFNIKKIFGVILTTAILSMSITACNSGDSNKVDNADPVENTSEENISFVDDSYIVDIEWLKENLNSEELLIVDARGEEAYNKEHISGAISVSWQQFSDMEGQPGDENWGAILEASELAAKLSELGITNDKKVVVYSDTKSGWGEDGRIVWMLRRAGMDKPVILDGGFNYWKSEGNEISKQAVVPTPATVEISSLDNSTNITTKELSEKYKEVKIIDVRSKKEYNGATDYGEPRGGHIPGAINIDFYEFINKNGTLKQASEIKKILDSKDIKVDDEIVTYCTAGIRSAHMQIVLDMMGYKNVKNYDQSFNSWAGNDNLEVVK